MPISYPSAQDLLAVLAEVKQHVADHRAQGRRLMRLYFSKAPQAQVRRAITAFLEQSEASHETLLQQYLTWHGRRRDSDDLSEPLFIVQHFRRTLPSLDLGALPSLDHIRLTGLCLWALQEYAMVLPRVKEALVFLRWIALHPDASPAQHTAAWTVWHAFLDLAGPQKHEAGPQSFSILAIGTLQHILQEYDKHYPVVRRIVPRHNAHAAHADDRLDACARSLHEAYSDIAAKDFRYLLSLNYDASYITRVLVERRFHLVSKSTESIRQTLRRARLDQQRRSS